MMEKIYKRIWELSPEVKSIESYNELTKLTAQLIGEYDSQGRLSNDPFRSTSDRTLSLPEDKISSLLKGATCLVTGGLGCVGSILVNELLKFDVATVVVLDIKESLVSNSDRVVNVSCDVRNMYNVIQMFSLYQPEFVFHLAAQRDPGFCESHVEECVSTNVLGTLNVVKACETIGTVKSMIFSSTGKASRYFTEEVYAASKKISEFIIDTYARSSSVKYAMARFTHILDNSLMNMELEKASRGKDYLAIHSPGKYVTAQNAKEAALLLLNGLVYAEDKQCCFLLVKNLEWPVESLEVALHHIKKSGRSIPVIFLGNPPGYSEKFFRGQLDWSKPNDLNLLMNVFERKHQKINEMDDIIISRGVFADKEVLEEVLDKIKILRGERETKMILIDGLKKLVNESLKNVDREDTMDILKWGLDPHFLEMENAKLSDFNQVVPLLMESLEFSKHEDKVESLMHVQV